MMKKCLYFICPTDCLETAINNTFSQENYYYSSLGNSVSFTQQVIKQTKKLIQKNNIQELSFVLSSDNSIVLDALGNQDYSDIRGLNNFYKKVIQQQE